MSNPDGATVPAVVHDELRLRDRVHGSGSVAAGASATVTGIPTGNTCTVTEVAPTPIPGFTWGAIDLHAGLDGDRAPRAARSTITVGNSITRDRGTLTIVKKA